MQHSPQYTVSEAAGLLNSPPSVIHRLSQSLKIPRSYYHPREGQPVLWMYSELELAILRQMIHWIAAGDSFKQAQSKARVFLNQNTAEATVLPEKRLNRLTTSPHDVDLKHNLAKMTFGQYKQKHQQTDPPLLKIAQALHRRPNTENTPSPTEVLQPSWKTTHFPTFLWRSPCNTWPLRSAMLKQEKDW